MIWLWDKIRFGLKIVVVVMMSFSTATSTIAATLNKSIVTGADDGYMSSESLGVFWADRDYGLTGEDDNTSYHYGGWFRFTNITIPRGSDITSATLTVKSTTNSFGAGTANTIIYAVDEDNHAAPTNASTWSTDHGLHTSASVAWDFSIVDANNTTLNSPDISSVIEEVVARSGWSSGNAIGIHWDENMANIDRTQGWSTYENTSYAEPQLSITYTAPAVTVTQSGGSTAVTEGTGNDTYTVVLTTQPTATVTITPTGNADVDVSPASLNFTTSNWGSAQTITVTAVDDSIDEDQENMNITHAASSADANYNGISVSNVGVTITDNDTAGVTITESGGSTDVTEGGATDTYTVVLNTKPTASVTVTPAGDGQVTPSPTSLTFTTENWNSAQTVTVTAVDDEVAEASPHTGDMSHSASSSDSKYSGINIETVTANITDNDVAGATYLESVSIDTQATAGFTINSIYWEGTKPTGSLIDFQVAVSTSSAAGFEDINFEGSNGTSASFYNGAASGEAIPVNGTYHNPFESGYRYFRYRVYLDQGSAQSAPVVTKIVINWSR